MTQKIYRFEFKRFTKTIYRFLPYMTGGGIHYHGYDVISDVLCYPPSIQTEGPTYK